MAGQRPVKNSHEVSRRLTKSWEFSNETFKRHLWYFNFETNELKHVSSKRLLVSEVPYGDDVEGFLGNLIESPQATYLDSVDLGQALTPNLPWKQERAVTLSLLLQTLRREAATGDAHALTELQDFAKADSARWDRLVSGARSQWRFVGGRLSPDISLFFPSVGFAAVPFVGAQPGLFQPTSPQTFVACVPASLASDLATKQLRDWMGNGGLTAFSVGIVGSIVVVPPGLLDDRSPGEIVELVLSMRHSAKALIQSIVNVNRIAGLDTT